MTIRYSFQLSVPTDENRQARIRPGIRSVLETLSPAEASELLLYISEEIAASPGLELDAPMPLTPAGQSKPFDSDRWLRTVRR